MIFSFKKIYILSGIVFFLILLINTKENQSLIIKNTDTLLKNKINLVKIANFFKYTILDKLLLITVLTLLYIIFMKNINYFYLSIDILKNKVFFTSNKFYMKYLDFKTNLYLSLFKYYIVLCFYFCILLFCLYVFNTETLSFKANSALRDVKKNKIFCIQSQTELETQKNNLINHLLLQNNKLKKIEPEPYLRDYTIEELKEMLSFLQKIDSNTLVDLDLINLITDELKRELLDSNTPGLKCNIHDNTDQIVKYTLYYNLKMQYMGFNYNLTNQLYAKYIQPKTYYTIELLQILKEIPCLTSDIRQKIYNTKLNNKDEFNTFCIFLSFFILKYEQDSSLFEIILNTLLRFTKKYISDLNFNFELVALIHDLNFNFELVILVLAVMETKIDLSVLDYIFNLNPELYDLFLKIYQLYQIQQDIQYKDNPIKLKESFLKKIQEFKNLRILLQI